MYSQEFRLRVPGQNGVSLLYTVLEIHHSGREPSICGLGRDVECVMSVITRFCLFVFVQFLIAKHTLFFIES